MRVTPVLSSKTWLASLFSPFFAELVAKRSLLVALTIGALIAAHLRNRQRGMLSVTRMEGKEKTQAHDLMAPLDCEFAQNTMQSQIEPLLDLSNRSREFLENVSGFLTSKRVLDAIAEEVLPRKWMELHPSFEEPMEQKNLKGEKVKTLDELLEVATIAKPIFDAIMDRIVRGSGLDPEKTATDKNGRTVMLVHDKAFTVLTLAPLKNVLRLVEKVTKELDGDFSRVVDVVRCSVVVFTEDQLEKVAQFLKSREKEHTTKAREEERKETDIVEYEVVRLKNRFKDPLFNGYRDALYNIVVQCGNGVTHVCEVQLHLADIVAHKEHTHVFYEYFRTYFSGSKAEASRMKALEKIDDGSSGRSVDQMIASILGGSDLEQLNHLAYLIEDLMGDVKIALLIRKRILGLDENNWESQSKYGNALFKAGELPEAEVVLRKVLSHTRQQLGNSHAFTLASIHNLASLLQAQGKLSEAEPLFREALNENRQLLGNLHSSTLRSMDNLALLLKAQGKLNEAEPLYREVLTGSRSQLGDSHPDTLSAMNNLASLLHDQGELNEAELLFREALDGKMKQLGNSHPSTLTSMNNLALLLMAQGELSEAEPLLREALDGMRQQLGDHHPDTLTSINSLAALLKQQGKFDEAEPLFQEALEGNTQQLGNFHLSTLTSIDNLALLLQAQGKLLEAEPLLRAALNGKRQQLGNLHPATLTSINNLAKLLHEQGKLSEAEPLFREALDGRRQRLGNSHSATRASMNNLALLLMAQGKQSEAEALFREAKRNR